MYKSGGGGPKRHSAWSNSPSIGLLNTGRLIGWNKQNNAETKPVKTYTSKTGKRCYTGTKHLKATQILDLLKSFNCYLLCGCFFVFKFVMAGGRTHIQFCACVHWIYAAMTIEIMQNNMLISASLRYRIVTGDKGNIRRLVLTWKTIIHEVLHHALW